jgi:catechol 2,3-dioxygenase-like lactoylglutathione lyase family enzyme
VWAATRFDQLAEEKIVNPAMLEHANVTVSNPEQTATLLCELFGWRLRWQGPSSMGGRTVHVGTDHAYLALYTSQGAVHDHKNSAATAGGLNHIGVLVDDLDDVERRVRKAGFKTHNHADYEPGLRFYFNDLDGIEYEVVAYPEAT